MSMASEAGGGAMSADDKSSLSCPAACTLISLPWPPRELSPNFRTRRNSWLATLRKRYRRQCADILWDRGIQPVLGAELREVIIHAPNKRWDDDNARAAFKSGRDGVADALGVDDNRFNDIPHRMASPIKGGAIVVVIEIPG